MPFSSFAESAPDPVPATASLSTDALDPVANASVESLAPRSADSLAWPAQPESGRASVVPAPAPPPAPAGLAIWSPAPAASSAWSDPDLSEFAVSATASSGSSAPRELPPTPAPVPSRRRRGDFFLLFAASLVSAILASTATAGLVVRPAPTPSAAPVLPVSAKAAIPAAPSPAPSAVPLIAISTAAGPPFSGAAIAAAASPAVGTIETHAAGQIGLGSGFIYAADGYILTAAHVVEGANALTVTLADGRAFPGTVKARDLARDVAVVKIAATSLPTIPLGNAGHLQVGQTVMAIGDPLGQYPGSVTIGIISGLDRSLTVADELTGQPRDLTGMIQTDAAINQGNSGGPLLDSAGAAIGLISAASAAAQDVNFVTPISAANTVIAAAKSP